MKARQCFVSNSSSSSFYIATNYDSISKEDVVKVLKKSGLYNEKFINLIAEYIFDNLEKINSINGWQGFKNYYVTDIPADGDGGDEFTKFIRDEIIVNYDNGFIKVSHDGSW